ncbi:hypothetical protein QTN25_006094 [Entamoeba marina]
MLLLLTSLFVLSYSQTWVDETTYSTTTIFYNETATISTVYFVDQTDQIMFEFSNEAPVETSILVVDFLGYSSTDDTASFNFTNTFNSTIAETFYVKPKQITKYVMYFNQDTGFLNTIFSCYRDTGCTSPSSLNVYVKNTPLDIKIDDDYSNVEVLVGFQNDNSQNANGYPYLYIGDTSHFLGFNISFSDDGDYLNNLSGKYYLFTTVNSIIFVNIVIDDTVEIDSVLFSFNSTNLNLNLTSFGLFEVEVDHPDYNYVVYQGYVCRPNGPDYIETDFVTNSSCNLQKMKEDNGLVLQLASTGSYTVTENEYWNILSVSSDVIINGIGSIHANVCEFQHRSLTIDISLYCKKMRVSVDTTIVISSVTDLTIDTLIVHSFYTNELNSLKFITSAGKVTLSNVELDYSVGYDYENYLICKTAKKDETNNYLNFINNSGKAAYHCPCFDENCTIQIENNDLNLEGIEFNGTIEISTQGKNVINIKYINKVYSKSSSLIYFEKDSSVDRMSINSIVGDGKLYIKSDCNIYSSFIPEITPLANVYLLNESVTILLVYTYVSSYVPIIITSIVESINVTEIYYNQYINKSLYGTFLVEKSTEILTVTTIPITNSQNPFVFMKQQSRKLDYIGDIQCDNQAIIMNSTETICNDLNLCDHYCYYSLSSDGQYYQNDYTTIDYSCPCNKSNSNCIIELDKNEIMTYEVDLPITTIIVYQDVTINPNNYDFSIQTKNDIDVTFNSINDNVIYVNDESTQFTINTPLTGNLLLISSLLAFSQSITKSVTTVQSLQVSTDYYCTALSIENESNECLMEYV